MSYDYEERRKAEQVLGVTPTPPAKSAAIRKADLEAERIADQLPWFQFPGPTRLFALHGTPGGSSGEAIYRILSAHAHGRRWRLLLNPSTLIGPSPTGGELRSVTASDSMSSEMTQLAVRWAGLAMTEAERYFAANE